MVISLALGYACGTWTLKNEHERMIRSPTKGSNVKNNDTWIRVAKQKDKWKEKMMNSWQQAKRTSWRSMSKTIQQQQKITDGSLKAKVEIES